MHRTTMAGERIPATRTLGGINSRHQYGYNSGGPSWASGVLGPRRERHNRAAKAKANGQRRTQDRRAVAQSLADWEEGDYQAAASAQFERDQENPPWWEGITSYWDERLAGCCHGCGARLINGECPYAEN